MKNYIARTLINFLYKKVLFKRAILDIISDDDLASINAMRFNQMSYAQEGEDIIMNRFLYKSSGFYVDVGAHHPRRFSNTFRFYRQGWKGINIDANPQSLDLFNTERPADINLNIAVGTESELTYYRFEEPALNTLDPDLALEYNKTYKQIDSLKVSCSPLSKILEKHLPSGIEIDFFSIDVENFELEVLKSNDWNKYRPAFVIAEELFTNVNNMESSELGLFMKSVGYEPVAKTFNSIFFKRN